jgi:hypothetical protein
MANALSFMYNARGFTLSFTAGGGKILATGISSLRGHFLPISARVARTPWGINSSYQMIVDGNQAIRAGDKFVLQSWDGVLMTAPRKFTIDGVAEYPNSVIHHQILTLTENEQR